MNELLLRSITGAIYVALTLAACWAGGFTLALLFLPVCLAAADEFHKLCWPGDAAMPRYWNVMLAGATYLVVAVLPQFGELRIELIQGLVALLAIISVAWALFLGTARPVQTLGSGLLTIVLIALPFALLPHFREHGEDAIGPEALIGYFLLLWSSDTGAYITGRMLGRIKLMPAVSPKKTVEGLLGGIALTLLVAWLLARSWPVMPLWLWLLCGAVVAFTSTVGDLFESALKRSAGVKDSGTLLPGHGGVLDRFDGLLLSAPAMYLLLELAA